MAKLLQNNLYDARKIVKEGGCTIAQMKNLPLWMTVKDGDKAGETPLSYAACAGRLDVVRLLLDKGAVPGPVAAYRMPRGPAPSILPLKIRWQRPNFQCTLFL